MGMSTETETAETPVVIRVLGDVTAERDREVLSLGGPKQVLLVALLAANLGRPVSVDVIAEALWDDAPPRLPKRSIQVYISNLRSTLGDVITHGHGGYVLDLPADSVDAHRFEDSANRALTVVDPIERGCVLSEGLALWSGRAFRATVHVDELRFEAARLEELRLVALEMRIHADLEAGRHAQVIPELDVLTREHPLREGLRAMQMRALYASGRQSEALRAYARTRQTLAAELGIEPGPELAQLEQRILEQSSELEVASDMSTLTLAAILMTDVEGSSALWDSNENAMRRAMAEHDSILLAAIAKHSGSVFKTLGDGVLAAFETTQEVVDAATDFLRQLASRSFDGIGELHLTVAVDHGPVDQRSGDYFGRPLNRAARLLAAAHGGQVLISEDAATALDASLRDLGEYRFRGLGTPERVFQLVADGLSESFPDLVTSGSGHVARPGFSRSIRGFEIRELVGEGEFSEVFRAYQAAVGREVAIKLIRSEHASNPAFVRRFEAEAQFVAQLEHPHIVSLLDYWRDPTGAYLVMPYMRGNLERSLTRVSWTEVAAVRLLEQIGAALSYAHRNGVLHRDIKPSNVLLDEEGNAYLSDFGISSIRSFGLGTEHQAYVAPEEMEGAGSSPQSDIYSLGVVAFELLTNVRPIATDASIPDARPDLSPSLDEAIRKAIALLSDDPKGPPQNKSRGVVWWCGDHRDGFGRVFGDDSAASG